MPHLKASPGSRVSQAKDRLRVLQRMRALLTEFLTEEPMLGEAAGTLLSSLENRIKERKQEMLAVEVVEGCPICGAQSNENCRVDLDIGHCEWAEDMKEVFANCGNGTPDEGW